MKKTVFSIAFLLGGIFMVAILASARDAKQNDPVTQAQQQEDYYTCTMHPEVVSNEPGTCPICGMKLVLASSLGSGMMMHTTGDTVVRTMQGHMMPGGYMTGDSLHMMQGSPMQGNHMTGDSLHMMHGNYTIGDSLHMRQRNHMMH